jgi:hypothetical protein
MYSVAEAEYRVFIEGMCWHDKQRAEHNRYELLVEAPS